MTKQVTGRIKSKQYRFLIGLCGTVVLLAVLLPLLLTGRMDGIEYRGLDSLQQRLADKTKADPDITIIYIDQKSIDFFQQARGIGWPWPRDAYALIVSFLKEAGAKAIVFDAIFSEPSVFANDFDDDNAFASAMADSGRVFQTLVLHSEKKGGAPANPDELARVLARGLKYQIISGPPVPVFHDVTMPIPPIEQTARGLGVINIRPENDGLVRRLRPVEGLTNAVFPTLGLGVFLKLKNINSMVQYHTHIEAEKTTIPIDRDGMVLVKYYGGLGTYQDFAAAAVIQSAMQIGAGEKPLIPQSRFKDKIVFIGAKAASLYDLRVTPMDDALPGVEIHATFLNNLLHQDFLERANPVVRATALTLLLLMTLAAAVFGRSVLSSAVLSICLTGLYIGVVVLLFQRNIWLDSVTPIGGQVAVFILAALINHYGEGREKQAIRGAFSRYLSPDVVNQVIEQPELLSLGGSRRVMSVFFSDLAGFTTISEALSPEELVRLLNRYLGLMTGAIMQSGGTVDKYEGDAIMAFWGAPLPQDDHALRACLSALKQQEIMDRLREEVLAEGLPRLEVRMGINTGPMIVGNMGSEERFDYTVMGDAVNLASRLEGANKPFGTFIMISEATYVEVKNHVEVRELDLLKVKGKNEPIRVFELLARSGNLSPQKAKVTEAYYRGLELYRDMQFEAAEKAFLSALELDPNDGPSKTYLDRTRAYKKDPPPEDWDRVFTMTTK